MKFFKLGLVLIALVIFAIACNQNATNSNSVATKNTNVGNANAPTNSSTPAVDELASAKKIFADKCADCHRENGEGGPKDIEGDKFKVPSFKDEKVKALDL